MTLDYPQENLREARSRVPAQPRALGRWTSGGRRGDMQGKEKAEGVQNEDPGLGEKRGSLTQE